ncbi:hypothetical protein KC19_6G037000 [Ceratodon purpureus]|uniref:Prokaryotic-type class I peptide chain release factors domain-containing protein n=1 Tax=Ceratodon purpureus TaxID=3225 RepID=A0A8T0HHK9_CERPU|nr:hypothetical protein KC19_6G037000 [Ceratodon purpureus]
MGKQSWRWLMKMAPVLGPLVYASRGHHTTLRPGPALTCTAQSSSSSLQHGVGCEKEKYFWQALRGCQGNSSLPSRDDEFGGEGESFEGNWKREERLFGANAAERKREREQEVGVADVDWLKLTDGELQRQCRVETLRSSGPGGQHRNKTESAVRLLHLPTGLVAFAAEDRSQHKNRSKAFKRLREVIAMEVRRPVELKGYRTPPELMRILPSGPKASRKREGGQKIGPNHDDFVQAGSHESHIWCNGLLESFIDESLILQTSCFCLCQVKLNTARNWKEFLAWHLMAFSHCLTCLGLLKAPSQNALQFLG